MKKPRRDESHDMALDLDGHPIPMAPGRYNRATR